MKRSASRYLLSVVACVIFIPEVSAQEVPDRFVLTSLGPDKVLKPGLQVLRTPDKWGAQISPDKKKLVFTRSFTGTNEVWVSNVDGNSLVKLTSLDGPAAGSPRWSPDGRWIAFDVDWYKRGKVFIVSANGGPSREIAADADGQNLVPNWSRDGKWIYFASDRSGDWQVWKAPLDGGRPEQVTHQGGFAASESPDGAYVYYSKHRYPDPGIWRISVTGDSEEIVSPLVRPMTWADWSLTAGGIYFVAAEKDGEAALHFFDFTSNSRIRQSLCCLILHSSYLFPTITVSWCVRRKIGCRLGFSCATPGLS
jgi:dipeptidyl aminopeptidase/acylaminoacyl peptidase